MHKERSVRNICDFDAINIIERRNDLFIVGLAGRVDGDIPNKKIFTDADDIDAFDITSGLADRRRDLAELSGFVVDLYAQCEAVTCIRGRGTRHKKKLIVSEIERQMQVRRNCSALAGRSQEAPEDAVDLYVLSGDSQNVVRFVRRTHLDS